VLSKFDYHKPSTVGDVVDLLSSYGEDAKILNGGTDLLVDIRNGTIEAKHLIDIKSVVGLGSLKPITDGLSIGAAVTLNSLIQSRFVVYNFGLLHKAANLIGDCEIRGRGTLVGNICNASPAGDTSPALLVLDAKVRVAGAEGDRVVSLPAFFKGVKSTTLKRGEFVTTVEVPNPPKGHRWRYMKQKRIKGEDLSTVGVAVLVAGDTGGIGNRVVRVALSSVAPTPIRVFEVEEIFKEQRTLDKLIDRSVEAVLRRISPISDLRGSNEYRMYLAEAFTRQSLRELLVGGVP